MSSLGYGFYPSHPGEVIKDELEERGISQRKFADSIGIGYSVLNEILNGRRSISTTSALMFEAALDIPADSLLKMQMKYNMYTAMKDQTLVEKLKNISRIAAIF
ncbi:HigA family addiction module antitoxin [Prevotella sp.]|uniref:HigA family addiction module antitoxin n=1 Tax=uncultured Prevotella sp. TaxID=159272 RepID=UPI0025DED41D|nr:HigA family addiction module antitoxin [Prevotella sp.]MCI7119065.1 HigA family addiction module antitoxin [Prevotella sp.]